MKSTQFILCLDIDGTLIDRDKHLHPKDAEILGQIPKEIQLILTTGRTLPSAKGILHEKGLFTESPFVLPGVFMNGGIAYLPGEVVCVQHPFSPITRETLIELAKAFPQTGFIFFSQTSGYILNNTPFAEHIVSIHHLNARASRISDIPDQIIKVEVLDSDPHLLHKIQLQTESLLVQCAYSLPYAYEINPSGITKAKTLHTLLNAMGLIELPIIVAGDAENDLALFEIGDISYAPSTALPAIRDRADHIVYVEKEGLLTPILKQLQLC